MVSCVLKNGRIVLPTKTIPNGYILVEDGKIAAVAEGPVPESLAGREQIDCGGMIVAPGFIDLHAHGGGGFDFMDGTAQDILGAARAHLIHGTTTIAPTTMTSSDEDLFAFIDNYKQAKGTTENMPHLAGMHLEGPYFSPAQAGAQPPEYLITPKREHYMEILRRCGDDLIRWSLAVELDGAMELGDELRERGIIASIGHSNAAYDVVKESLRHGYTHLTHFYSGMSTITRHMGSRVLGVIECGYLFDELDVEIIADGKHLPPELLRLILKNKPHEKISLVSDSMRGAGMPEGPSVLGCKKEGMPVIIKNGIANMLDFSGFAGSVATSDRLVRTMVQQAGLELHEAVAMMSLHPAKLLHRENELGSIEVGKRADLVLLDDGIVAQRVFVDGKAVTL